MDATLSTALRDALSALAPAAGLLAGLALLDLGLLLPARLDRGRSPRAGRSRSPARPPGQPPGRAPRPRPAPRPPDDRYPRRAANGEPDATFGGAEWTGDTVSPSTALLVQGKHEFGEDRIDQSGGAAAFRSVA